MNTEVYNYYNLIVNIVLAVATILIFLVAIWGDWVKLKIFFKLKLELKKLKQEPAYSDDTIVAYVYHLQIIKKSKFGMVKNCRLLLTRIQDYKDNVWVDIPWNVSRQFHNAPQESNIILATFPQKQIIDFGMIRTENRIFSPQLRDIKFFRNDELVPTGKKIMKRRYFVEIEAENYYSKKPIIYEVTWNGEWSDNPNEMERNFKIELIPKL